MFTVELLTLYRSAFNLFTYLKQMSVRVRSLESQSLTSINIARPHKRRINSYTRNVKLKCRQLERN